MNRRIDSKLKRLFEEIQLTEDNFEIAVPFVPYIGPDYWTVRKKVLVVGKATDGWGWKDGLWNKDATLADIDVTQSECFEELANTASEFIEKEIIPIYSGSKGYYNSLFWNRIYHILGKLLADQSLHLYSRDPRIAKEVFRSFAWTNVFKVAHTRGNPKKKLREKQIECNTLKDEIEYLKPHAILFFTSRSYDKQLEGILPKIHIENEAIAEVSGLDSYGFEGIALRTHHPQYYKFDMHEVVGKLARNN